MYARFLALCLAMLLGSLPALAAAPLEASTDHVQARLLSSRSSVACASNWLVVPLGSSRARSSATAAGIFSA
jgi:hypothetical protein